MIGKVERVPLREVWKHEALDLTAWLEENIDVLNEVLDFSVSNAERERQAGAFSVDLVAQDEAGNPVVIENQLERTNHEHLGKLITYLVAIGAKAAIWIVADPRPEHVGAISWLNESSSARFYLVKIEAVRIGDSPPAPLLTLIVGPSEETRDVGKTKEELAEGDVIRRRFWTQLLDRARQKTKLHATISPGKWSWIGTGAGRQGLSLNYVIGRHQGHVELYIDRGKDRDEENKAVFDSLGKSKGDIEATFGEPLEWERLETRRASRIRKRIESGGYRDEAKWEEIYDAMIDAMIRLENALRPHIAKLQV